MIRRTNIKRVDEFKFVFCGFHGVYPGSGDIVKQMAIVLHFWNIKGEFPIDFEPMNMGKSV